jgi:sulfate transport system permease protein
MNLPRPTRAPERPALSSTQEHPVVKWLLVGVAGLFAAVFLLLPLLNIFVQAFSSGPSGYWDTLKNPQTVAAIRLTLLVAGISVPLNVAFGVAAAWAIAKFDFPGKAVLLTFIDLPFAVSPVVAGLMLLLLCGANGLLGHWLEAHGMGVIFAVRGMVLATMFVTFPYVARELIPIMQDQGREQEEAALTLGAGGWQTFWHVSLPSVKWGLFYGIILCNARAMGEYGAVSVVSSKIAGKTDTLPLRVEKLYNDFGHPEASFAVATLLAVLALITLVFKTYLEWKSRREGEPV